MWIASAIGFFSIVQKGKELHVRGRFEKDLRNLETVLRKSKVIHPKARLHLVETPLADYRFRFIFKPEQISGILAALSTTVTYDNFKSEIDRRSDQRDKHMAYQHLWSDLACLASPSYLDGFFDASERDVKLSTELYPRISPDPPELDIDRPFRRTRP